MTDGILVVDLTALEECAGALERLKSDFEHSTGIVDGAGGAVGNPHLLGALHDFAGNWEYHRQRLGENLESVLDMARNAHQAYTDVDNELANQLDKARGGGRSVAQ